MGPHFGYIFSAYAVTGIVLAALILRAIIDWRGQRRAIEELERRGHSRRALR